MWFLSVCTSLKVICVIPYISWSQTKHISIPVSLNMASKANFGMALSSTGSNQVQSIMVSTHFTRPFIFSNTSVRFVQKTPLDPRKKEKQKNVDHSLKIIQHKEIQALLREDFANSLFDRNHSGFIFALSLCDIAITHARWWHPHILSDGNTNDALSSPFIFFLSSQGPRGSQIAAQGKSCRGR